jgi:hypothetical protein
MTNQQHSNKQKEKILYTGQKQIYTCKNKTKQANKTNKKTDRMFVHTPKLK